MPFSNSRIVNPAVSGTGNGTADYIVPGVSGEIFLDKDEEDLYRKIALFAKDRSRVLEYGKNAYESIVSRYSFAAYRDAVLKLMELAGKEGR